MGIKPMEYSQLNNILDKLPKEKTLFYYQKDEFALFLLQRAFLKETSTNELKKSIFSNLLNKDIVRKRLASMNNKKIKKNDFNININHKHHCYILSCGSWGSDNWWERDYYQTSRSGYNIVLRLNFSNQHDSVFNALLSHANRAIFECQSHPIDQKRITLAWSRIDLDLDKGEALIEEIQNDWLRLLNEQIKLFLERILLNHELDNIDQCKTLFGDQGLVKHYICNIIKVQSKIWSEAMMTATILFLYREFNIKKIFYHSNESADAYKYYGDSKPPKSIYSSLPKKFCFSLTQKRPDFLSYENRINNLHKGLKMKERKRVIQKELQLSALPMYQLNLN
jgi:hypothetical protein